MSKFSRSMLGLSLLASGLVLGTTQSTAASNAGVGGRVRLLPRAPILNVGPDPVRVPAVTHLGAGQILDVAILPSVGSKGTARLHSCSAPASSGEVVFAYDEGMSSQRRLVTDTNSDCLTATTDVYLTIFKDGDVAETPAPDRLQYVPLAASIPPLEKVLRSDSGTSLDFGVTIPAEARAAVVVLGANDVDLSEFEGKVNPLGTGSAFVFSCGHFPLAEQPNHLASYGSPSENIAYVPLETDSGLCLYSTVKATFRATLLGWLATSGPDRSAVPPTMVYVPQAIRPPGLVSTSPVRVLDSRNAEESRAGKFGAGTFHFFSVGSHLARRASAVVLNVTVDQPDASGFITMYDCNQPKSDTSNLNYQPNQTIANAVTVKLSYVGEVCLFTSATTHVIVDFMGSYVPNGGSGSQVVAPVRLLDTRNAVGLSTSSRVDADSIFTLHVAGHGSVPAVGAEAVTLNVTVDQPETGGFVTVYPCGEKVPIASNLNYAAGQTIANLVTVKIGQDGNVCFYSSSSTHLIADLAGWHQPGALAGFKELEPVRVLDSRNSVGVSGNALLKSGSVTVLTVAGRGGVPANGAEAVTMNVTVDQPQAGGFLTVFPCGQDVPTASNLNYARGQTVANLVNVKLAANGTVCIFTSASAHVLADVAGYGTTTPDTFWAATLTR
jgi:hypothetical protein